MLLLNDSHMFQTFSLKHFPAEPGAVVPARCSHYRTTMRACHLMRRKTAQKTRASPLNEVRCRGWDGGLWSPKIQPQSYIIFITRDLTFVCWFFCFNKRYQLKKKNQLSVLYDSSDLVDSWNSFSRKTRSCLSYTANMAANDLTPQGPRS